MENTPIKRQFNRINELLDSIIRFTLDRHGSSGYWIIHELRERTKCQNITRKTLSEKISDLRYLINEKSKSEGMSDSKESDVCFRYQKAECTLKEFDDSLNLIESGSCAYNELEKSFLELKQHSVDIKFAYDLVKHTDDIGNFYAYGDSISYRLERLTNLLKKFDALVKAEKCLGEICEILKVTTV